MTDTTQQQTPPNGWSSITIDLMVNGTTEFASQVGKTAQDVIYQSLKTAGSVAETLAGGHAYVAVSTLRMGGSLDLGIRLTVAVDSGSPDAVAKVLFETGVGFGVGAGAGWLGSKAPFVGTNPWFTGAIGVGTGAVASYVAGDLWNDSISDTPVGEWSKDTVAGLFDLHTRIVSSPNAPTSSPNAQITNNVVTTGSDSLQIDNASQNKTTTITSANNQIIKTETVNNSTTTQNIDPLSNVDQYRSLQADFKTNTWVVGNNNVTIDLIAAATGTELQQLQIANPTRNLYDLKIGDTVNLPTNQNGLLTFNNPTGMFNTYNMQTGELLANPSVTPTINNLLNLDNQYNVLFEQNILDSGFYNNFTSFTSNQLVNTYSNPSVTPILDSIGWGLSLDPIGAFYDSRSPANDPALSIADKTAVILNAAQQGMSVAGLTALDTNHDNQLSSTELSSLKLWTDSNENGLADAGEIQSLTRLLLANLALTASSPVITTFTPKAMPALP